MLYWLYNIYINVDLKCKKLKRVAANSLSLGVLPAYHNYAKLLTQCAHCSCILKIIRSHQIFKIKANVEIKTNHDKYQVKTIFAIPTFSFLPSIGFPGSP